MSSLTEDLFISLLKTKATESLKQQESLRNVVQMQFTNLLKLAMKANNLNEVWTELISNNWSIKFIIMFSIVIKLAFQINDCVDRCENVFSNDLVGVNNCNLTLLMQLMLLSYYIQA